MALESQKHSSEAAQRLDLQALCFASGESLDHEHLQEE